MVIEAEFLEAEVWGLAETLPEGVVPVLAAEEGVAEEAAAEEGAAEEGAAEERAAEEAAEEEESEKEDEDEIEEATVGWLAEEAVEFVSAEEAAGATPATAYFTQPLINYLHYFHCKTYAGGRHTDTEWLSRIKIITILYLKID